MRNLFSYLVVPFFLLISVTIGFAQTIPVGFTPLEEYIRRQQLLQKSDSNFSFHLRPVLPSEALNWESTFAEESNSDPLFKTIEFAGRGKVVFMPVFMQQQYNSHHPVGTNDGSMIPNKGMQRKFSAGIYVDYGPLSLQLMPEHVWAQNLEFQEFDTRHYEVIWWRKYVWWNRIDAPVRFGQEVYSRLFAGQSSLRFNYKEFSTGISTENLWWGPSKRNALLMSNNAPGFLHFTLNTRKPKQTAIGSFEGQFIAGRLNNSNFTPPDTATRIFYLTNIYHAKEDRWRYISGLTTTWQPKWVPGLFFGYARTYQVYHDERTRFKDWLPFFNDRDDLNLDFDLLSTSHQQMQSVFFRYLLTKSNAEIYAEYGTNGNTRPLREFIERPNLHRAFTAGVSKIYSLKKGSGIQFEFETTQMGQVVRSVIRDANSWYLHPHIRHGYTNMGQVIGAGVGPGGNVQYLAVNWFNGMNRIGVFAERFVHNNDFFYFAYEDSTDWRRFWTDLSTGILADWRFGNLLLSSHFRITRSWNYQWYLRQNPGDPYFISGKNVTNLHASVNLAYLLN
ncbi:MAG TPA: capsule assembly Wzi family protein [Cyclobacteriaceae bacterium]|nr:capsule assembly Wzi family protein [Cyclobacteriaceae bacterium]